MDTLKDKVALMTGAGKGSGRILAQAFAGHGNYSARSVNGGTMKELVEYRTNLLQRLEDAANAFRSECLAVKDPYAPLNAQGWNVHQIAVHTRDVDELVYGLRARRTAVEDNPEFPNFDGDAYMAANYNSTEPLGELLDGFVKNVQALTELLRALPMEAWSRVSHHPILGSGLTLQAWVEKDLAHIEEHLQTVRELNGN